MKTCEASIVQMRFSACHELFTQVQSEYSEIARQCVMGVTYKYEAY